MGNPNNDPRAEFQRDVRDLLARDDVQCRDDICRIEYQKALNLVNTPGTDNLLRGYNLMGNLSMQFEYIPAILWMGDFMENAQQDYQQALYWYKKAADLGDGNGARNYADMLMAGLGGQPNYNEAFKYYSQAADAGIPEAAFVLGEFLRNSGDRENALKAYQKALSLGYTPAQNRINQMRNS